MKIDWAAFCIHFVFGFILGGAIGFYAWGESDWATSMSAVPGVLFVLSGGLLVGGAAGLHQEEFWEGLGPGLEGYHIGIGVILALGALGFLLYRLWGG